MPNTLLCITVWRDLKHRACEKTIKISYPGVRYSEVYRGAAREFKKYL